MTRNISFDEIREIVKLKLGARQVDESSRLIEDLRAESMDIVSLAALVEERYGVMIRESELSAMKTVGDLHALIRSRTG